MKTKKYAIFFRCRKLNKLGIRYWGAFEPMELTHNPLTGVTSIDEYDTIAEAAEVLTRFMRELPDDAAPAEFKILEVTKERKYSWRKSL